MGFVKSTSSTRCRYAACFALGFVVASLILAAMFWIIWCYMGLTIVQISDTQRRGLVNYSYTTAKTPTTSSPANRTEVDGSLQSSLNAISKGPVTPPSPPRRSDPATDLAKGDFASRTQGSSSHSQNSTRQESTTSSATSSSEERKASILHKGEEDGLHPRKISSSNTENRAHVEGLPEIKPTQTYAPAQSDPSEPKDERRPISRDSGIKDEDQSSRPSYRDPEFEREPPPRRYDTERRRHGEEDDYDDRGSPSRYDKRDRGRETDDRYSKGDTRVYPDERPRPDDRYPPRDTERRRGDDRDREDRYRDKDDRHRDYDRYQDREDRYRPRDEEKHRNDRPYLDDDKYRPRDDRYHDSGRYPPRYPDDDNDRSRDRPYDDRSRDRPYDDRSRDRPYDDRSRDRPYDERRDSYRPREDEDRSTRPRDKDYKDPIVSSRTDFPPDRDSKRPDTSRRPSDYDIPIRDRPGTSYLDESRTADRYPSRGDESKYEDRERIYPTRTRDEAYPSRATVPLSRSRDDDLYYSRDKERSKYYDDHDRRVDESRSITPSSFRDSGSTRLPGDKNLDDVSLERRSHSEEEEYRLQNSRTKYYNDRDRKPSADSGRDYRTDEEYPKGTRTDDYDSGRSRPRGDHEADRPRDPYRYDRPSRRYPPEYEEPTLRGDADVNPRKDSYPRDRVDDDRPSVRRPEGRAPAKDRRYDDDIPSRRYDDDIPARRYDPIDDRPARSDVDRSPVDGRRHRDDKYPEDDRRRYKDPDISSTNPEMGDPFRGSSTSPRDVRENRRPFDGDRKEERPTNAKDVIEAALKHPDSPNKNSGEVYYPVFDPRTNLTVTDYIPLGDRRGTTITSRNRRSRKY